MSPLAYLLAAILLIRLPTSTDAHGRLIQPSSRMSSYLAGYGTPVYYNDHEMNCGGRRVQWDQNGGKCGICGDPWSGPRYYERPNGAMVQHNVITGIYLENEMINIILQITVAHKGWHEFRICDVATCGGVEATQECLNRTLLADENGMTRFTKGTTAAGYFEFPLVLPEGLTCKQCVIQWKWKCGNDYGCFPYGDCCTGCGDRQEEFYGCSDVTINSRNTRFTSTPNITSLTTETTTSSPTPKATTFTLSPDTTTRTTRSPTTSTSSSTQPQRQTYPPTTQVPTTVVQTTTTTTPTTTRTTTKSPEYNGNNFLLDIAKKYSSNYTNNNSIKYSSNSNPNNPSSYNKAADEAFINMVLGHGAAIVPKGSLAVPVPIVRSASSSANNENAMAVPDKDAKDRLCAACKYTCRFDMCHTYCPDIC